MSISIKLVPRISKGPLGGLEAALGGLLVIVLANGPTVRGFKTGRRRWILGAIKINRKTSYTGEVKPSHVVTFYGMLNISTI
jgi:hypothetical protein